MPGRPWEDSLSNEAIDRMNRCNGYLSNGKKNHRANWDVVGEVLELSGRERVCNVVGSREAGQGSQIQVWKRYAWGPHRVQDKSPKCCLVDCLRGPNKDRIQGGHINIPGHSSEDICYLVPMCHDCNNDDDIDVDRGYTHVFPGTLAVSVRKPEDADRPLR